MKPNVFSYHDYKSILKELLLSPTSKRGLARELSKAAQCQPSYLSSVLHGHIQLTPDHACGIAEFWHLSQDETEYFLLLVDLARAGSKTLKDRITHKLKALKEHHEDLSSRLKRPSLQTDAENSVYYSSWAWSAIHILVSIPEFQDPKKIASHLRLSEKYVLRVLAGLKQMGLVSQTPQGHWVFSSESLHVPRHSPFVITHHQNWRQQAISHAQTHPDDGIHYTNVTSVSAYAFEKIKKLVLDLVDDSTQVAGPSEPQTLVALTIDFFKVDAI